MLKRLTILMLAICAGTFLMAQVTTSTITGSVKDNNDQPLVGATITATHLPSGTKYATTSTKDGFFVLNGLRIGGPYQVVVNFIGFKSATFDNITLKLGEPFDIRVAMNVNQQVLENVLIASTSKKAAGEKSGMSSVINNRMLGTMPSLTRSITDFSRTVPQANDFSFGGRDGRYNNITIDGANLNNSFGLSSDPFPGGGNNPISLDAVDEVSVSLAPYDVRQGNFTGANIAAITKSGTNTFHGTVYTYWKNQDLVGTKLAGQTASNPDFKSRVYGGSLGGPIIKNKLFFFINGEYEKKPPASGITYTPTGGSGSGNVSTVSADSLKMVSDYLKSQYNYDPGVYDNFPAFKNTNHKYLAKIDWNISTKHKLTLKYSDFLGEQDFQPSQSGGIAGADIATYGPKFSPSAMAFSNSIYTQQDIVKAGTFELNSRFSSRISNQFLATFTKIRSDKTHPGATFPFLDIMAADKRNYISAGNEPFNGNNNKVHTDVLSFTDNFTYYAGKHTLTAGASFESQKVGNMFMAGSQGYYLYGSVQDFLNNRAPLKFAQTYSLIPGQDAVFSAQLKIAQLSAYVQDDINVSPNFKLSVGLRMDKPIYPEQPLENPATSALTFLDGKQYTTGKWPKASPMFSPRASFRWDLYGDKSLIIRGGSGLFTGRIPFVYLTNIPTNSGMYQYSAKVLYTYAGVNMNNFLFNPDPQAYNPFYNTALASSLPQYFPTAAGAVPSSNVVVTDPKYKFPQVWRTDLGIEQKIGDSWKLTLEAMFTKDINATYMFDANQKNPDGTVTTGSYTRGYYTSTSARKINQNVSNAIVLASSSKGSSFVFTAQIEKSFSNGWYGSLAYNYTYASNLTENPGSQAASTYNGNATAGTLNDLQLSNTSFALPHHIVSAISKRFEYAKHFATTISLVYEGSKNGAYSYIYSGSVNNQGQNSANLMYIPKDATNPFEIKFVDHTYNGVLYTAAQQAAIFEYYIRQDPYLSKHRGQVADRNGAFRPWYNEVNLKFIQDVFTNIGKQKHTIQFSADIYNIPNLINHQWGARKSYTVNNPLTVASVSGGVPSFYITPYKNVPVSYTFFNNITTSNTWAMQLGLRYIF
ncbi:MAG TPA: carboxypeptidase regulatory-like domain-containing protein [Chitinophagaceae bacterium]|nr:carboxypeptidase regulatory-like domain-containing protein [Chitinophagaceae bacterium]